MLTAILCIFSVSERQSYVLVIVLNIRMLQSKRLFYAQ